MAVRSIAFVCAMPMELVPLTRALGLVERDLGGQTVHTGRAGEYEVVGMVTGMGTVLAAENVRRLLDDLLVDHLFVVGIAGAGVADVAVGSLVMPEVVVHGPTGREHRPARIGDHVHAGHLWTSDELISDVDELHALQRRGVVALDMETAAVARVCELRGVPWSVFRAISDRTADELVDLEVSEMRNRDNTPNRDAIAAYFERHPEAAARLERMAADASRAAETAAAAAIAALDHL